MNNWVRIVFFSLCLSFLIYSFCIYNISDHFSQGSDKTKAFEGKMVWQSYNCQACHQLYGLGGYLGPDLTNVYSAKGKGPDYVRALLHSGSRQMPAFSISPKEEEDLLEFLRMMDASGKANPAFFEEGTFGMIQPRDKN